MPLERIYDQRRRSMSQARILVVDDETDLVELIRFNLERHHYRVLTAHDGQAAIDVARREKPDLIVLDLMLPLKSGRDVTLALKTDADTRTIPIIMLTAMTAERDVV